MLLYMTYIFRVFTSSLDDYCLKWPNERPLIYAHLNLIHVIAYLYLQYLPFLTLMSCENQQSVPSFYFLLCLNDILTTYGSN